MFPETKFVVHSLLLTYIFVVWEDNQEMSIRKTINFIGWYYYYV